METWKYSISATPSTVKISSIQDYICPYNTNMSPIDTFYEGRNNLLRAITPENENIYSKITPLIIVGLISQTENYIRDIMAGVIKICPISKKK
ncbi:hypothetical protein AVI51_16710 (plasmid) [Piscirickettsia salmonis]|uniref:hypothetical protein n=1 Tax=Piscirickettsia salmonis TaxID=1238 RepID=UPI00050A0D57|nr:hypothetical protein [Piscirickettsia salmonis]APS49300.1 hypothetical protein AVI49_16710 [Piscirickettsia salmonis]APS52504.1 hypothetical protein AVI50_16770 [Piscirickettsia salmonis]APS55743.1 hypothetical protein AVI51_16710 [Piscirickettsia salmonis]APS59055.1 hypothetical protein AVI52_17620 [Piscirickettsia salmonis]PEQ16571.1 hypothetical protein X973_06755 [Piscirickettsia salmonis]